MPRRTGELLAALLLALPAAAPAEEADEPARLSARADRTEIVLGEVLAVLVEVEGPEPPTAVEPPTSDDFSIVSRGESRQSFFGLSGGSARARHVVRVTFGILPRRAGPLTIPAFAAVVGGTRLETPPIAVVVAPAAAAPAGPSAPAAPPGGRRGTWRGWERDLALEVRLDRRDVFLGEQATASVWLLSPVPVVGTHGFRPPSYDGFWAEIVESPRTLEAEVRDVGGVPTRAYLLQRVALFPTRAGALSLGAFEADVEVRLGGGAFDPFPAHRRARRRSPPLEIRVRPLPAGAPGGFEAVNVGKIDLAAEIVPASVAAGEPATVRLTASGEGNVRAWSLPRLARLAGARAYEPTSSDRVEPRRARVRGARLLETVIVPDGRGEVVIPPVSWSFFDPAARAYRTVRTAELRLAVSPGAPAGSAPGANPLAAGLRPIRSGGRLAARMPPPWRGPLFLLGLALPVLGFAGLAAADLARERARAGSGARRLREAGRAARRRLARAGRLARRGGRADLLAEVERALVGYASDKLARPAAGLTRQDLARALGAAGAHAPAVRALASALDACDAARFGGSGDDPAEILSAAERALRLLEEADWGPGEGRA
jgi:hypothetical protein